MRCLCVRWRARVKYEARGAARKRTSWEPPGFRGNPLLRPKCYARGHTRCGAAIQQFKVHEAAHYKRAHTAHYKWQHSAVQARSCCRAANTADSTGNKARQIAPMHVMQRCAPSLYSMAAANTVLPSTCVTAPVLAERPSLSLKSPSIPAAMVGTDTATSSRQCTPYRSVSGTKV